jgi:preprotein translocase subunit SecG
MYNIILFLIIILSFLLVLVIMVQNPKGGGLASTFGGDSQQIGGVKKTTDFLDKSTWILVSLLFLLILFSNITLNSGNEKTESDLLNSSDEVLIEEILEDDDNPED